MERDGLITRIPDADDRRRSVVMLTPEASALEDHLISPRGP
jgi:DNA-binding MarR family transcriptional regulator